jgi:hypothetical protein
MISIEAARSASGVEVLSTKIFYAGVPRLSLGPSPPQLRGSLLRDRPNRPGATPAAACQRRHPAQRTARCRWFRNSSASRRQPAAANSEAALLPLGLMVRAKRMQQGTRDTLIARDGEELVCPKGTICGRMTRDANDQITDGDFAVLETCVSPDGQRYVCACCERTVAVREHFRWRVHLRRGWIR